VTLSHDVTGDGPAVVLLHSMVCDRRMWDPQMPALAAAGYRAVRCDLRGFGETPAPDQPYDDPRDVVGLLDLLGIEDAALVGSSGGGRVALEIAARWPRRVASLTLICTAMAGHEGSAELKAFGEREEALLEAGDIGGATDLNVDTWLGPRADEATREKVRAMQRGVFEIQLAAAEVEPVDVEADLSAITAPTLLISGGHDLPDFGQIAARLADELRNARHLELPWAGHLPSLEDPDAFDPVLVGFLTEPSRR
jgi:pimeloyl-ACP methyl ester carboxylesterase